MNTELTAFNSKLSKVYGIDCFSTDVRIILYIVECPDANIKDAQYASGLSHRGFYLRLRKLMQEDFVVLRDDSTDGRKKLLTPTDKARALRASVLGFRVMNDDFAPERPLLRA